MNTFLLFLYNPHKLMSCGEGSLTWLVRFFRPVVIRMNGSPSKTETKDIETQKQYVRTYREINIHKRESTGVKPGISSLLNYDITTELSSKTWTHNHITQKTLLYFYIWLINYFAFLIYFYNALISFNGVIWATLQGLPFSMYFMVLIFDSK